MSYYSEMEWNAKWDWENIVAFGSKANGSPKKLQLADWMIVDDGEISAGSFNLSGGGGSGASGSDGWHDTSAKSSISVSTDSSTKNGMHTPNFKFMKSEGYSRNLDKKMETKGAEITGTSLPLEASIGSVEPIISLKLGKRTYFENSGVGGNPKATSFTVTSTSSSSTQKKSKSSVQSAVVPRCQVEGCNLDLSLAKEYHKKHRVCDSHSKCPKVIVEGLDRRFCQQCSRFHGLLEFDGNKRSCRRRLSDHNARRRKPQQETIDFNSTRISSPCYGGRQQVSFQPNKSPLVHPGTSANSTWDSTCNSKFTVTKEYPLKSNGDGGVDAQLRMPGIKLPRVINMHGYAANGHLVSKSSTSEILSTGSKGAMISSQADAAPEYHRALSLLSSNYCEPESIQLLHPMHVNDSTITQPISHAIPEGVPLSSSEFWLMGSQTTHPRVQSWVTDNHFQDIHLSKTPCEADVYSNMLR